MKTILLSISGLILFCYMGYSQLTPNDITPSSYEVQLIPASPDVSNLWKYGNLPVNPYNGTANINIPIFNIKLGKLSIPISLNYNTSGVRVEQEASWVGLGWNLSEGMVITREINGYDDINSSQLDSENVGWIYTEDFIYPEPPSYQWGLTETDLNFLDNQITGNNPYDTEPDVFQVTLPTGGVKFYLPKISGTETHLEGRLVSDRGYKVKYDIANKTFEVVDQYGNIYEFNQFEYSTGFNSWEADPGNISESLAVRGIPNWSTNQTRKMIKAWKVTKITTALGRVLNLSYQDGFYMSFPHFSEKYNISIHTDASVYTDVSTLNSDPLVSASLTAFHVAYLDSISGDFGTVEFNTAPRIDLFSKEAKAAMAGETVWNPAITPNEYNAQRLNQILVKNPSGNIVSTSNFYHSYFNSQMITDPLKEKYIRLKLDSLSIDNKVYAFEYEHPESMPAKDSKSIDFWGFYNGLSETTRLPSYNRFFYAHNDPLTQNGDDFERFYKLTAASRKSDVNYGKYGILNKVVYPTKGYTVFNYEGNTVSLKGVDYEPVYYGDGSFRRSGLSSSESYNFRYQYLKLANDPGYSLYDNNPCGISSDSKIEDELFTITSDPLCNDQSYNIQINATLSCSVGCGQGIHPSGRAVWLENVDTGTTINVFSYDGHFDSNNNSSVSLSTTMQLSAGNYRLRKQNWSITDPYLVVATSTCSANVYFNRTSSGHPYEEFEVGGARIAKMTNYNANGGFISGSQYAYDEVKPDTTISSSGILMDDLVYTTKAFGLFEYTPEDFSDQPGNVAYLNSDNMVRTNPSASGSHIGYSYVIERRIDEQGNSLGKITNEYINVPNEYLTRNIGLAPQFIGCNDCSGNYADIDDWDSTYTYYDLAYGRVYVIGAIPKTHDYKNGKVISTKIYDDDNMIKQEVTNTYSEYSGANFPFNRYPIMYWAGTGFPLADPYLVVSQDSLVVDRKVRLLSSFQKEYYLNGDKSSEITYGYNSYLINDYNSKINSRGEETSTTILYPEVSSTIPDIIDLHNENRIREQYGLDKVLSSAHTGTDILLYSSRTEYGVNILTNNLLLPSNTKILNKQTGNEGRIIYEGYDEKGNLLQYRKKDGIPITYLWGYNGQYPVAKIENATYAEVLDTGVDLAVLESTSSSETAKVAELNLIRNHPSMSDAMVTTYTYAPLVGITSITDPKGQTTSYEYDPFNRLEFIKDDTNDLLEEYQYHYRGE